MLIILDDSLQVAAKDPHQQQSILTALNILELGFREGRHILGAKLNTIDSLMLINGMEKKTKASLNLIKERYSELMGLVPKYSIYASVVASHEPLSRISCGKQEILRIPISHFSDSAKIQNTILLCEHLADAPIAELMADFYRRHQGLGQIPIKTDRQMGGGANIGAMVDEIAGKNERLCIIIVDSDKKSPSGAEGSTAKHVKDKIRKNGFPALIALEILPCREMENTLPDSFYEAAYDIKNSSYHSGVSFLKKISSIPKLEIRDFIDIKKGLSLKSMHLLPVEGPDHQFLKANYNHLRSASNFSHMHPADCIKAPPCINEKANKCPKKTNPQCVFLVPGPSTILQDAANIVKDWPLLKLDQNLSAQQKAIWLRIGQKVFEWSCGWAYTAT